MDDAKLLEILEMLLKDRFKSLKATARTGEEMQYASEFGWASAYVRERIKDRERLDSALAPFVSIEQP